MSTKNKIILIHCQNGRTSRDHLVYDPDSSSLLHGNGPFIQGATFMHPKKYFFEGDPCVNETCMDVDIITPIQVVITPTIFQTQLSEPAIVDSSSQTQSSESVIFDSSSFVSIEESLDTNTLDTEFPQDQIHEIGYQEDYVLGVCFDEEISHDTVLSHISNMIKSM